MNRLVILILTCVAASCSSGEYSNLTNGVEKKLVRFGDGPTSIKEAKYLEVLFSVSALNNNTTETFHNQLFLSDFHPSIFGAPSFHSDLANLKTGDSVVYKLSYFEIKDQILDEFTSNNLWLADSTQIRLDLAVNLAMTYDEFLEFNQERVQHGLAEEMSLINEYLSNKNLIDKVIRKGDLFYLKTSETGADSVTIGDEVAISYTCSFLNETVFDEVTEESPLFINLGTPDQVIDGIESVLKELREGETAIVIIPSYLGFGENGSTDGRVPPKTPIIANIKLVEILN